jgi:hypothetical protein
MALARNSPVAIQQTGQISENQKESPVHPSAAKPAHKQ